MGVRHRTCRPTALENRESPTRLGMPGSYRLLREARHDHSKRKLLSSRCVLLQFRTIREVR